MAVMTSESLIAAISRCITVPTYQARFSSEDILALAMEELQINIYPLLKSIREDFFVYDEEIATVTGTESYPIPKRAAGRGLRELKYRKDSTENWNDIPRIMLEDFRRGAANYKGRPTVFMILGDSIKLGPVPDTAGFLLAYYFIPHNELVLNTSAFKITSVLDDCIGYTGTLPSAFVTGAQIDIIQGYGGHTLALRDQTISSVSTDCIYLSGYSMSVPITGVAAGDYCAIAEQTPIVMLPTEIQPVLIQAVAVRINEALGSMEQVKLCEERMDRAKRAAMEILTPRVEGAIFKIVNNNGLLRRGTIRRYPAVTV